MNVKEYIKRTDGTVRLVIECDETTARVLLLEQLRRENAPKPEPNLDQLDVEKWLAQAKGVGA